MGLPWAFTFSPWPSPSPAKGKVPNPLIGLENSAVLATIFAWLGHTWLGLEQSGAQLFVVLAAFGIETTFLVFPWFSVIPYQYTTNTKGWLDWVVPGVIALIYAFIMHIHVVFGLFFAVTLMCLLRGMLIVFDTWWEAPSQARLAPWIR